MSHLLVTNDYPPKLGGIQTYLWELWRRLPPGAAHVVALDHPGAASFDAAAPHEIVRVPGRMLLPTPSLAARVRALAVARGAGLVVLDPALPLGLLGPQLGLPYAVVLHGAEVTVPARLPGTAAALRRVLGGARLLVAAGRYPAGEARRLLGGSTPPIVEVPPGADLERFRPLSADERAAARRRFDLPATAPLVVSVSRLVPRKGMDVLLEAAAALAPSHPGLVVVVGGEGRDRARLERLAGRCGAPVRFLGRVEEAHLPGLVGCADVAAMICRDRWLGLEQEGFGIVFLEAAAAGVATLAGRSGGSEDAVVDEVTGLVADRPGDVKVVTEALGRLLGDGALRARLAGAARERAAGALAYDRLAGVLAGALAEAGG